MLRKQIYIFSKKLFSKKQLKCAYIEWIWINGCPTSNEYVQFVVQIHFGWVQNKKKIKNISILNIIENHPYALFSVLS